MADTHVTIKLPRELVAEMDILVGQHGFRSRGEIAKEAIRDFLGKYQKESYAEPYLVKINSDENGVKIHDKRLRDVVQIYIKPNGIRCSYHQTNMCEHVTFALNMPETKALVREHRKEGWKLPDV